MTQATIHAGGGRFGQTESGRVWGAIVLRIGDQEFPHPEWTDFIVTLLSWWSSALVELLQSKPGPIEVNFMEGPYLVQVGPLEGHSLRLLLIEERVSRNIVVREDDVDVVVFVKSVLSAADETLFECLKRNWWGTDEKKLVSSRDRLRNEAERRLGILRPPDR